MKYLKADKLLTTKPPKSRLDRKIVINTRLEVPNIIAEADFENSLTTVIRMLNRKMNVKLKMAFRLGSILLLLIRAKVIKAVGKP